jgi:hypothetical protein
MGVIQPPKANQVTPTLGLPTMVPANGDISVGMFILDSVLHGGPKSATTTAPPVTAQQGDTYIVPSGATGAWAGQTGKIAICNPQIVKDGVANPYTQTWDFIQPKVGMQFYVQDIGAAMVYNTSGAWQQSGESFLTTPPANSTSTGIKGQIAADASYLYYCYAANTWRRVSGATF